MDKIPENRDPSYPFAQEQRKATKIARYKWMDVLDHLLISLSSIASARAY
jgi:hypothetical protein